MVIVESENFGAGKYQCIVAFDVDKLNKFFILNIRYMAIYVLPTLICLVARSRPGLFKRFDIDY